MRRLAITLTLLTLAGCASLGPVLDRLEAVPWGDIHNGVRTVLDTVNTVQAYRAEQEGREYERQDNQTDRYRISRAVGVAVQTYLRDVENPNEEQRVMDALNTARVWYYEAYDRQLDRDLLRAAGFSEDDTDKVLGLFNSMMKQSIRTKAGGVNDGPF